MLISYQAVLLKGATTLTERSQRAPLALLSYEIIVRQTTYEPGSRLSPDTRSAGNLTFARSAGSLTLDFPVSRMVTNKFPLFISPGYGVFVIAA